MPARFSSMWLRSEVSVEPLWIALRNDWQSVHMTSASCDGKSHWSAIRARFPFGVNAPVCYGWAVYQNLTDLQDGPTNGGLVGTFVKHAP